MQNVSIHTVVAFFFTQLQSWIDDFFSIEATI